MTINGLTPADPAFFRAYPEILAGHKLRKQRRGRTKPVWIRLSPSVPSVPSVLSVVKGVSGDALAK